MRVISYIGEHSNKVRTAIWQAILLAVAMGWITLQEAQLAVLGMFLDAMLGLFVETNTVSRVRVGERINEGVEKIMGTGSGGSNSNTSGGAAGGTGLVLVLLCAGLLSTAACAKGMHVAAQAENVVHDGVMAFDRALDARCDGGELTAATCKELNQLLVPVWDIKNDLNRTIRGDRAAVVPTRIESLRAALTALIARVNALVHGGAKEILLRELNLAVTQA